jgi:hypothetical protein
MIPKQLGNAGGGGGIPSGELRYPSRAITNDTDYVRIRFYEYRPPFSSEGFTQNGRTGYNRSITELGSKIGGDILLYMPQDISAQYGANWSDMNFSNVARSALGAAGKGFNGDFTDAASTAVEQLKTTISNGVSKGTAVAKALSEILQQTNFGNVSVNDVFSGITGQIFNPNTEVIYKGPKMRGFSLEFKMAPTSDGEAKTIQDIIRLFKYAMLPKYGNGGGIVSFVKVPAIADITFMSGGRENMNVTQFKPCAMADLDISYTPDGAWATYRDGQPVATTLKATFQELKMVYQEEIADGF